MFSIYRITILCWGSQSSYCQSPLNTTTCVSMEWKAHHWSKGWSSQSAASMQDTTTHTHPVFDCGDIHRQTTNSRKQGDYLLPAQLLMLLETWNAVHSACTIGRSLKYQRRLTKVGIVGWRQCDDVTNHHCKKYPVQKRNQGVSLGSAITIEAI